MAEGPWALGRTQSRRALEVERWLLGAAMIDAALSAQSHEEYKANNQGLVVEKIEVNF